MKLINVEVRNFRALEHVTLDNLRTFNVLTGRNNSGKSSVLRAIEILASKRINETADLGLTSAILTDQDATREFQITLTFVPQDSERKAYIAYLTSGDTHQQERETLEASAFMSQIRYEFGSVPGNPHWIHLARCQSPARDGNWVSVVERLHDPRTTVVSYRAVDQSTIDASDTVYNLLSGTFRLTDATQSKAIDTNSNQIYFPPLPQEEGLAMHLWPVFALDGFLRNAFFFSPFRHSLATMTAQEDYRLAQDGSNLAQVLHTIGSNDQERFQEIQRFIHSALPDVGTLHAPLYGTATGVAFRNTSNKVMTKLHDMGGGVEQLLMVAAVLVTTGPESAIFLEEPEIHLHPGAQRILQEALYASERQIFLTTHSPTFINASKPGNLFQVKYDQGRTSIIPADASSLGNVLEDIGARNSDVLLSDAVLFIEGASDRDVFETWANTAKTNLSGSVVTVLTMQGGAGAPIRSEVLTGISQKAPVPHVFVLDRDERSQREIETLQQRLGDHLHLLQRRELENYLLVPRAILAALKKKHGQESGRLEQLNQTTEEEIERRIQHAAESLYETVFIKRLRNEIGPLPEGLLPRDRVGDLISHAGKSELADILRERIEAHIQQHLDNVKIQEVVAKVKQELDDEWSDPSARQCIAPGADILSAVFQQFQSRYRKTVDALLIAQEMQGEDIANEIVELLRHITHLAVPNT